jgi:hypothetical protein
VEPALRVAEPGVLLAQLPYCRVAGAAVVSTKRKALVYCQPNDRYYARYVGRQLYGAFVAGRQLNHFEIESFRTDPEAWISPSQIDPTRPEVA